MTESYLKITQKRSRIGSSKYQRRVLDGLGLKKMNQSVVRKDTPEVRGMINKISHLLSWEPVEGTDVAKQ